MSLSNIFNISGSALVTQSKKMEVHATNLANSDSLVYKNNKLYPYVAKKVTLQFNPILGTNVGGIKINNITDDTKSPSRVFYNPSSPIADSKGYAKTSNVDVVSETINAIEASKDYETNLEVLNAAKNMIIKTLTIGQ